jgi:hypothetical protein
MGEATYYLKARFKDAKAAEEALPKFAAFIKQGQEAEAWWGNHRKMEREGKRAEFWAEFKEKFPSVYEYLGDLRDGDCDLARALNFGWCENEEEPSREEDIIYFTDRVWHFADWGVLCAYLETKFGAVKTDWLSDEYHDPFDALEV